MPDVQKRILVVDDDDAIRTLLFTILRRRGLTVDTACNGEQALAHIARCSYSIVLLDLMMPVKNGWKVLEEIEELPRDVWPMVIVLTAGNEPRSMNPDLVAGTIRKPFDVEMIIDMVSACLAAVQARQQHQDCPQAESEGRDGPSRNVN
jgi:DNA-binding response OmpR family regulator